MRRVRLVDAQLGLARIGDQPGVEHARVLGVEVRAEHLLLREVALEVGGVGEGLLQGRARAHRGARPVERRPAREAEPRLVPQEDEVGLDREALLHHAAHVVDVAVEGAVGQRDRPDLVEPAGGLEVEQRLLDVAQRHGAVHRVRHHREGLDVVGLRARQHHPVVVRLVAVAVGDDDVAGLEQRLVDHLVRGRRAVGHEEHAVGAEGARGRVLRLLDVARRLEQAVQPARRRRRLREEQVGAVELAHVADPVRLEDRLAARHRQRVEGADRLLRVLLQVVEERRLVALGDAGEDREVDLERLLDLVEDAAEPGGRRVREDRVGLLVGEQDDVELRPEALHELRQHQAVGACRAVLQLGGQPGGQQVLEQRHVVRGFVGEAVVDHDRLEVGVEDHGERRVLERADEHRLVDELVLGTPQLPDLLGVGRPARRRRRRHEQHLEVGSRGSLRLRGRHRALRRRRRPPPRTHRHRCDSSATSAPTRRAAPAAPCPSRRRRPRAP